VEPRRTSVSGPIEKGGKKVLGANAVNYLDQFFFEPAQFFGSAEE
jgi:hypothetical protein